MVFSSLTFLFYFLPAVLAVYFLVPRRFKNLVLLIFSLAFYGWGEPVYIFLMIFSILMDYGLGRWLHARLLRGDQSGARQLLILSVALNLALLAFFKYTGFVLDNLNRLPGVQISAPEIALPIGISFYTFQAMSYLIDLYRGNVPVQKSVVAFGAYVSLFPQLIAGPIVRMATVSEELADRRESADLFSSGIRRFLTGLGKKVLLANNIGAVWAAISTQDAAALSVLTAWIGLAAFTFQIYFDFSGYSDMAIGLGRMFGFHFLENFDYPYTAVSITDFWRRWHISLSTWFREYVYIPLGGNRRGRGRQLFNLLVVWMLTGVWHGASWNFVVWGLYFGLLLALEKFVLQPFLCKAPRWVCRLYTLLLVMISWGIFAFDSLADGLGYLWALVGGYGRGLWDSVGLYTLYTHAVLLLLLVLFSTPLPMRLYRRAERALRPRPVLAGTAEIVPLLLLGGLCVAFLVDASYNPFLYFRF
ncbi:MAG: MBOAT family protein [Clostridiales bacterium]|nr:MBOAT family protein [Clostridiales bacterium]